MPAAYHLAGTLQAALFLLSICATYVQYSFIRKRRNHFSKTGSLELATDNLSVLAITGAFSAFFSFLLLSTATQPFAHYIFWSRIPACILAALILWEFRRDHPHGIRALLGPAASTLLLLALAITALRPGLSRQFLEPLQLFMIATGVFLMGGQLHQLWLLLTLKRVGALSLKARTLNLMKDLSTVMFGFLLGVHQSWSFMMVASANAILTALVIAYGMRLSKLSATSGAKL